MTYYPSDCPNTPRVFEPDALSFRGGGGSGVERGVFTAPLNFWNSNVATHRFSVFTLYSQGERRGWPWRWRGHGQARTRFTSPTVGIERKPYFTCKMNRFYVGQVFGKRLASGCGDRARARIIDDLFAGHRPYQSSHEKNVY